MQGCYQRDKRVHVRVNENKADRTDCIADSICLSNLLPVIISFEMRRMFDPFFVPHSVSVCFTISVVNKCATHLMVND